MLKVAERCSKKLEFGSIPFNMSPLFEQLQPIVFQSLVSHGFVEISTWWPKSWNQLS